MNPVSIAILAIIIEDEVIIAVNNKYRSPFFKLLCLLPSDLFINSNGINKLMIIAIYSKDVSDSFKKKTPENRTRRGPVILYIG